MIKSRLTGGKLCSTAENFYQTSMGHFVCEIKSYRFRYKIVRLWLCDFHTNPQVNFVYRLKFPINNKSTLSYADAKIPVYPKLHIKIFDLDVFKS